MVGEDATVEEGGEGVEARGSADAFEEGRGEIGGEEGLVVGHSREGFGLGAEFVFGHRFGGWRW